MKTKILKILLISILSIPSVHSKANEIDCGNEVATMSLEEGEIICLDCWPIFSFKEIYSRDILKDEIFFMKGVAWDIFEYGRTIDIIEDLKGNFDGESSIFVWGDGCSSQGGGCIIGARLDNMLHYDDNDTLIMLVQKSHKKFIEDIETSCDYTTLACASSVLKLSNGYVTGGIYSGITSILWEELQKELLSITAIQSVRIKNNIYQWNGTIFFENSENKVIKLSFYDLSGKLIHEAIATSDSYCPVLTGNIFVCKINIDDEVLTIKYIVP